MAITAPRSGLAPVNGIELWYEVHGEGRPLVLLHGGFGSSEQFGPNLPALAAGREVIAVDLQSHGRSPFTDRPMRFASMADDIAALIRHLGLERADVMGFSLGGGVALRTGIQHPEVVDRLVLASTPFRQSGWHPEMFGQMRQMGPEVAEPMSQTPLGESYRRIAPRAEDWPKLVTQLTALLREDYDWTAEAAGLRMPVMLVAGDADGLSPRHAVECFELLGGGLRDASWDLSGQTKHRLAILPGVTHYDMNVHPLLPIAVASFLDQA